MNEKKFNGKKEMKTQAKTLRNILKKHNITEASDGGKLSVRTERRYAGKYMGRSVYEWGNAVAHVRELTPTEIENLKQENKYLKIQNIFEGRFFGFAIIKY